MDRTFAYINAHINVCKPQKGQYGMKAMCMCRAQRLLLVHKLVHNLWFYSIIPLWCTQFPSVIGAQQKLCLNCVVHKNVTFHTGHKGGGAFKHKRGI